MEVTFYQMIMWDSASIGALISQPHPPFFSVFCDAGPGAANSTSVLSTVPSWELLPGSTGGRLQGWGIERDCFLFQSVPGEVADFCLQFFQHLENQPHHVFLRDICPFS